MSSLRTPALSALATDLSMIARGCAARYAATPHTGDSAPAGYAAGQLDLPANGRPFREEPS
jgi:hypothetical protein